MKVLYGASPMLYSGTFYGSKVDGAPVMVRQFSVVDETSRSYVIQGGAKVPKKSMEYNTGNFVIPMFDSVERAVEALRSNRA